MQTDFNYYKTRILKIKENILKIKRLFTRKGQSAYASLKFKKRISEVKNLDGSSSSAMEVTVPSGWSQVATDIIAQKYFRKTGVPQKDSKGKQLVDNDGQGQQLAHRDLF